MSSLKDIKLFLEQAERELYAAPMESTDSTRLTMDSVDDQIDSFLISFERDSVVKDEDNIMESLRDMSLRTLLEQDDAAEEAEDAEGEDVADEAEEEEAEEIPEPAGSETITSEEPANPPKLPIDMDVFAKKVARLVENGPTLLEVETVVVNRALNYLRENYDEQYAKALLEILDDQFDFNIANPGQPKETPFAVGAYAGGTGGLGGGG